MFKKLYDYLSGHGIVLMITGLVIALISFSIYYRIRVYGSVYPKVAIGFFIAGITIYVAGRFFVIAGRRKTRHNDKTVSAKDDM